MKKMKWPMSAQSGNTRGAFWAVTGIEMSGSMESDSSAHEEDSFVDALHLLHFNLCLET
jgi:hypothetical protein